VYYNLVITGLSVAVALFIGTVELLSILGSELNLSGGIWDLTANFNINRAGFFIVGLFVITWMVALGVWRFGHVEARWEESAARARQHRQPEMEQV
jgi:high-affinity nickel-transport protein